MDMTFIYEVIYPHSKLNEVLPHFVESLYTEIHGCKEVTYILVG